jgi:hypothetical protein
VSYGAQAIFRRCCAGKGSVGAGALVLVIGGDSRPVAQASKSSSV